MDNGLPIIPNECIENEVTLDLCAMLRDSV
jgi:hypothetical protein